MPTFIFLTIAWGVLAFGGVYPWAYQPLLVACTVIGLTGLLMRPRDAGGLRPRALMIALALLAAAVVFQLMPLQRSTVLSLSPATDAFLLRYDVGYGAAVTAGGVPDHPLSLRPDATRRALLFLIALSLFLLGVARTLSRRSLVALVVALLVLGALIGLEGIIQRAMGTMLIYGFWQPEAVVYPFGPFVDRNHFAGWMVMTLFLSLGYFWAQLDARIPQIPLGFRRRLLWLSSPEANQLTLIAFAILIMTSSLLLTASRSGVVCFAVASVLGGWFVARKQAGSRRTVFLTAAVCLILAAIAFVGLEVIIRRFSTAQETGMGGRLAAWEDTLGIVRDFPFFGTGLNAFGTAMLFYQRPSLIVFWQEAHNDYLHLAAEGGLLLGIPALATFALFASQVRRRFKESADDRTTYWIRVGAVTALSAIAIQEAADFSLQIPGNAVLFAFVAAIAIHRPAPRRATHAPRSGSRSPERRAASSRSPVSQSNAVR